MDGLTFQSHTVYRHRQSGERLLLIHHNPMNLCSLMVPEKNGRFELSRARKTGVDSIIALRRSGEFEERSPLAESELKSIVSELLDSADADDRPFLQSLLDQPQE